jgi:N-acetylated-alpha-linked acidic dipeptidase
MIEQLCASVGAPSMMRSPNELFMPAAEAVKQQGGQDLDGHRMSRAEDQSFRGIGIPSVFMAMGEQEANDALAACN